MKEVDARKAERVWQRVQSEKKEAPPSDEHLPALIMEQLQLSAAYCHLARQIGGRNGSDFMRLSREAKTQAACLKGILTLMSGQCPAVGVNPAQISPYDVMLRRCYGQELRLEKTYEGRKNDVEYGPVFTRLAQRSREHCCTLLELIGAMARQ